LSVRPSQSRKYSWRTYRGLLRARMGGTKRTTSLFPGTAATSSQSKTGPHHGERPNRRSRRHRLPDRRLRIGNRDDGFGRKFADTARPASAAATVASRRSPVHRDQDDLDHAALSEMAVRPGSTPCWRSSTSSVCSRRCWRW
jgi:hypothetical protein